MGNIPSLNIFSSDTIADVPPVNENFEKLRVEVNDNDSRILKLKTETSASISSLNTLVDNTKTEIQTKLDEKANKDLSNVDSSTITNFIKFDYANAKSLTVNTVYQAGTIGAVYGVAFTDASGQYDRIYAGETEDSLVEINYSHQLSGDGRAGSLYTPHFVIIPKDYYYKVTGKWTYIKFAGNKEG